MLDPDVSSAIKNNVGSLRAVVQRAVACGLPAGNEPGWDLGLGNGLGSLTFFKKPFFSLPRLPCVLMLRE